ncbi:hypothetical protein [Terrisporobacter petrolearius]|uniref:hypothetical protein n=1 Tax=Terrisporobacter petrolearius TaxID=1460447 RepID=UPI0022E7A258|nr:hypothetical protein [Terrisporobacter petrolearius]
MNEKPSFKQITIINLVNNIPMALIMSTVAPIIAKKFPTLFKLDPNKFAGRVVGNIPIAFIFVVIIGLVLTYYNVRLVPVFIFAFIATFIPLYLICFVVSMITNPIAMKLVGIGQASVATNYDI